MFLGYARGKVGDVVFTRADGEQITRARNRSPKNPRTPRQGVQRSILKTVSQAYSTLAAICDHSFEGYQTGTPNQSRFSRVNIDALRTLVTDNVNLSDDQSILTSQEGNFAMALQQLPVVNEYIVSEGSLGSLVCGAGSSGVSLQFNDALPIDPDTQTVNPSYADIVSALGVERGDQLTFCWVIGNDEEEVNEGLMTGFMFSRVILEPSSGDMTAKFLTSGGDINLPNESNAGSIYITFSGGASAIFAPSDADWSQSGEPRVILAATVILSRRYAGTWRRSNQRLVLNAAIGQPRYSWYLGDSVQSFMDTPAGSSLYLNQAVSPG